MAFKMNYSKGEFPFKKTEEETKIKKGDQAEYRDVQRSMYSEDDDFGDPTKYSDQEIREGAGASMEFMKPSANKRGPKTRYKKDKGYGSEKYGNYKEPKKVKTNIFNRKKKMKLNSIADRDEAQEIMARRTGEYTGEATAAHDVDFAFDGGTPNVDKDITDRKRKAVFDPKTGKIEERYKSKLGIYRPTGREITDQAYIDASK